MEIDYTYTWLIYAKTSLLTLNQSLTNNDNNNSFDEQAKCMVNVLWLDCINDELRLHDHFISIY